MEKKFGWKFWKIVLDIFVSGYFVFSNFENVYKNVKKDEMTKVYAASFVIIIFSSYLVSSLKKMILYWKTILEQKKSAVSV